MIRKSVKVSILIFTTLLLFRGQVFRLVIKYEAIKERSLNSKIDKKLKRTIHDEIKNIEQIDLNKIIEISSSLTNQYLHFSFQNHPQDLSSLVKTGDANCIGYARLFSSIAKYIIQEEQISNQFEVKHLVGEIYFLGWDIHQLFNSAFFKDHDYVAIYDKLKNKTIYFDPSVSDYFWINSVRGE